MDITCPQCRLTFRCSTDVAGAETACVNCPACGHAYQLALST